VDALLSRVHEHAISQPNKIAIRSEQIQLSYSSLHTKASSLAALFKANNCQSIGIWAKNSPDWVVIQLAAMLAKVTVIPIPTFFSPAQIEHIITSVPVDLVISECHYAECDAAFTPIELNSKKGSILSTPLYCCLRSDATDKTSHASRGAALITFTSGTTGNPKGVRISYSLIDQMCASLASVTDQLGIQQHLCLLPLAVMLENIAGVFLPLYAGQEVILDNDSITGLSGSSNPDLSCLSKYLASHPSDSLILTPELLKLLILLKQQGLSLQQLKFVAVGGGKVSPSLLKHAHSIGIPVYEGYGLSECGSVVALNTPAASKSGSVGKPLPHCRVQISDGGEICVYGPKMLGYLDTADMDADYVATGDLGYIDDDGFLFITGRSKNVQINSFGRNFNPEWIESELNALPGVIRSAVYGDAKPFITAVIQMLPTLSRNQLNQSLNQLNQQLPDYAQIKQVVQMHDVDISNACLLTPNGRIKRDRIQSFYAEKIEANYNAEECNA